MGASRPVPHRSRALPHPLGGPSCVVGAVARALVGCAVALCAGECAMDAMEARVHSLKTHRTSACLHTFVVTFY